MEYEWNGTRHGTMRSLNSIHGVGLDLLRAQLYFVHKIETAADSVPTPLGLRIKPLLAICGRSESQLIAKRTSPLSNMFMP